MHKRIHLLVYTFCFLVLVLAGCRGKCTTTPINDDFNRFFLVFKPGTYWLYRNLDNGSIDSVYVKKNDTSEECIRGKLFTCDDCRESKKLVFSGLSLFKIDYEVNGTTDVNQYLIRAISQNIVFSSTSIDFNNSVAPSVINGITHAKTVRLTNQFPGSTQPHIKTLIAVRDTGLFYFEVENHPNFGTTKYVLIKAKIVTQ